MVNFLRFFEWRFNFCALCNAPSTVFWLIRPFRPAPGEKFIFWIMRIMCHRRDGIFSLVLSTNYKKCNNSLQDKAKNLGKRPSRQSAQEFCKLSMVTFLALSISTHCTENYEHICNQRAAKCWSNCEAENSANAPDLSTSPRARRLTNLYEQILCFNTTRSNVQMVVSLFFFFLN